MKSSGALSGSNTYVKRGGYRNIISRPVMQRANIPYLDTWNETIPLFYVHREGECSHFTANSAYSVWVWLLAGKLRELQEPEPGQEVEFFSRRLKN